MDKSTTQNWVIAAGLVGLFAWSVGISERQRSYGKVRTKKRRTTKKRRARPKRVTGNCGLSDRLKDYNGWKNYDTWNVMLWINNDEWLYGSLIEFLNSYKGKSPYKDFIAYLDLTNERTPDGVKWISSKLDYRALNGAVREHGLGDCIKSSLNDKKKSKKFFTEKRVKEYKKFSKRNLHDPGEYDINNSGLSDKIKFIVNALKWRDKVNGNTYFAAKIKRVRDGKTLTVPFQYGYGEMYRDVSLQKMAEEKWLPVKYRKGNSYHLYERENKYPIDWNVRTALKRELTNI